MRRIVTSRDDWSTILVEDIESEQPVEPVVDQQPSDEKPKQEEPPTETQDVKPDEGKADAGAPEVQGPDPEAVLQEQDQPKTGGESSVVKYRILGKLEPSNIPERGPEPAIDLPDLPQPEIWVEDSDETRFKWEMSPKPEPVYMPEAGEGKPPI